MTILPFFFTLTFFALHTRVTPAIQALLITQITTSAISHPSFPHRIATRTLLLLIATRGRGDPWTRRRLGGKRRNNSPLTPLPCISHEHPYHLFFHIQPVPLHRCFCFTLQRPRPYLAPRLFFFLCTTAPHSAQVSHRRGNRCFFLM